MKTAITIFTTSAVLAAFSLLPSMASADKAAATGSFTGENDHVTTGGVSVIKTANGGAVVILDTNFSLDGAPEPSVGFGKDGQYVSATDLGDLSQNTGMQVFVVPASVDVDDFNEIYIWCEKFEVSLGVASLQTSSY